MIVEDWPSAKTTAPLYRELKKLELLEHVAELEAFGFTVLPPEKVGPPEQVERVRDAVLKIAADRKGCAIDELTTVYDEGQELLRFVLWEDTVFEKLILTPTVLGLVQWLVGTDCILSVCDAWVKGKGGPRTAIHTDWTQYDMPTMSVEPFGANFNYLLTDYSAEDGGLSFVPGSHRWRRLPSVEEAEYWADNAHAISAPAGSMAIWGDHTWHGAYPKQSDGLRLTIVGMYNRPHMQTQEAYRETVTDEALARNPARFARLMNVFNPMPWGKTAEYGKPNTAPQGYLSLFDDKPAGVDMRVPKRTDPDSYDQQVGATIQKTMSMKELGFPDHYKTTTSSALKVDRNTQQ